MELPEDLYAELSPHPDIHMLFAHYNNVYFDGELGACSVEWSSGRMTLCAGTCQFTAAGGCIIKLSEPILKLRPPEDLKETLLHEMIHAYIFLKKVPGAGPDGHGPPFLERMKRINESQSPDFHRPNKGYNITVCHSMYDEVNHYRQHWWKCDRCDHIIKRAMNRKPQEADCRGRQGRGEQCKDTRCLYHTHIRECGGTFVKIKEPEPKPKKSKKKTGDKAEKQQDAARKKGSTEQAVLRTPGSTIADVLRRKHGVSAVPTFTTSSAKRPRSPDGPPNGPPPLRAQVPPSKRHAGGNDVVMVDLADDDSDIDDVVVVSPAPTPAKALPSSAVNAADGFAGSALASTPPRTANGNALASGRAGEPVDENGALMSPAFDRLRLHSSEGKHGGGMRSQSAASPLDSSDASGKDGSAWDGSLADQLRDAAAEKACVSVEHHEDDVATRRRRCAEAALRRMTLTTQAGDPGGGGSDDVDDDVEGERDRSALLSASTKGNAADVSVVSGSALRRLSLDNATTVPTVAGSPVL